MVIILMIYHYVMGYALRFSLIGNHKKYHPSAYFHPARLRARTDARARHTALANQKAGWATPLHTLAEMANAHWQMAEARAN